MAAFKIGQQVNLIGNYNNKGRFFIKEAEVYSCGQKRMILTDARTGEEMNRWFLPARVQSLFSVVIDASENAEEVAVSLAQAFIAHEIARLERIMETPYWAERHSADGYGSAILRQYEEAKSYTASFIRTVA